MSKQTTETSPRLPIDSKQGWTDEIEALIHNPEFKDWFGDWENDPDNSSKVVDSNGKPLLVYFGGPSGITKLAGDKRTRTGINSEGFYFTGLHHHARGHATNLRDRETDRVIPSSVYSAFLNIRNPEEVAPGEHGNHYAITQIPEGIDGYIQRLPDGVPFELVVFYPEQVQFAAEELINKPSPNVPLSGVVTVE